MTNDWHSLEQGISFYLKQIVRDAVQERVSANDHQWFGKAMKLSFWRWMQKQCYNLLGRRGDHSPAVTESWVVGMLQSADSKGELQTAGLGMDVRLALGTGMVK